MPAVTDLPGQPGAYEAVTPGDTATGFTATNINPTSGTYSGTVAVAALLTCEDQTVNFSLHGTDPTAAAGTDIGHQLKAGESVELRGNVTLTNFSCIDRVSGSAGTVKATLYYEHQASRIGVK